MDILSFVYCIVNSLVSISLVWVRYLEKREDRHFNFAIKHKANAIETFLVAASSCIYPNRPTAAQMDVTSAFAIACPYVKENTRKLMAEFTDMAYTTNTALKKEYFDAIAEALRKEQPRVKWLNQ